MQVSLQCCFCSSEFAVWNVQSSFHSTECAKRHVLFSVEFQWACCMKCMLFCQVTSSSNEHVMKMYFLLQSCSESDVWSAFYYAEQNSTPIYLLHKMYFILHTSNESVVWAEEHSFGRDSLSVRAPDLWSQGCKLESRQEWLENFLPLSAFHADFCSVSIPPLCYYSGT